MELARIVAILSTLATRISHLALSLLCDGLKSTTKEFLTASTETIYLYVYIVIEKIMTSRNLKRREEDPSRMRAKGARLLYAAALSASGILTLTEGSEARKRLQRPVILQRELLEVLSVRSVVLHIRKGNNILKAQATLLGICETLIYWLSR